MKNQLNLSPEVAAALAAGRAVVALESTLITHGLPHPANVETALDLYLLANGSYPNATLGLKALIERPEGAELWDGPYLNRATGIIDPWGRPYFYKQPGAHGKFDIWTLGADGKEGGADEDRDLGSWDGARLPVTANR